MLELVSSKGNDEEEGSPVGSTELGGGETMDLNVNMDMEKSHIAGLQSRIRDLEAQLRDALAALDSERNLVKELREDLRL